MYEANRESHVAINTPFGQTNREIFKDIEMQGRVMGPIKAAVNMDTIDKKMMENPSNLYSYKNLVGIPALEMIDDVASVEKCGVKSLVANSNINDYIEMKKLTLNDKKCKQIHMGRENNVCPDLNCMVK